MALRGELDVPADRDAVDEDDDAMDVSTAAAATTSNPPAEEDAAAEETHASDGATSADDANVTAGADASILATLGGEAGVAFTEEERFAALAHERKRKADCLNKAERAAWAAGDDSAASNGGAAASSAHGAATPADAATAALINDMLANDEVEDKRSGGSRNCDALPAAAASSGASTSAGSGGGCDVAAKGRVLAEMAVQGEHASASGNDTAASAFWAAASNLGLTARQKADALKAAELEIKRQFKENQRVKKRDDKRKAKLLDRCKGMNDDDFEELVAERSAARAKATVKAKAKPKAKGGAKDKGNGKDEGKDGGKDGGKDCAP